MTGDSPAGRLLVGLLPEAEAVGLLALMLLHEARRPAPTGPDGDRILLDEQERTGTPLGSRLCEDDGTRRHAPPRPARGAV